MTYRVLINGFGRIGKLATRLAWYDHKKDFSSEIPTGIWGIFLFFCSVFSFYLKSY